MANLQQEAETEGVADTIDFTGLILRGVLALARRHILRIAIFFVRVGWAFRMIGGILYPFHGCSFDRLVCVRKFFHRFLVGIGSFREPLRTHSLSRAVRAYLRWIIA
jgi:hypothetical protein